MSISPPKRFFLTFTFGLTSMLGAASARAEPPATGPASAACAKARAAEREDALWVSLGVAGGATFWFTYATTALGAAAIAFDDQNPAKYALAQSPSGKHVSSTQAAWLALPVAGPFLTASKLPKLDPHGPMGDRATRTVLRGDGIAQGAAVGLIAISVIGSNHASKNLPDRRFGDPCESPYAPIAKNDGGDSLGDLRSFPLFGGMMFLVFFHPISEMVATTESRDKARLWALLPGPGPMIAAVTLHPNAIPGSSDKHPRLAYGTLGVAELSAVGLLASTPFWKHPKKVAMPEVKVGAGGASLGWTF